MAKTCEVRKYIEKLPFSETEKERLNTIHNSIGKQAVKSKAFRIYEGKIYTRKFTYNKAVQFVNSINNQYNAIIAKIVQILPNQHILKVNVTPLSKEIQGKLFENSPQYQLLQGRKIEEPASSEKTIDGQVLGVWNKNISQVKQNITPEQQKSISDLKSIDSFYSKYSDENIQRFIESKIPDSKVKYVLYRGTNNKDLIRKESIGIFLAKDKEYARTYGKVTPVIVNIKNLQEALGFIDQNSLKDTKDWWYDSKTDGIIGTEAPSKSTNYKGNIESIVVFEPSQITILNSDKTHKEFLDFLNISQVVDSGIDESLNEKIRTKLQQLYPQIKLEYTNKPIEESNDKDVFNQKDNQVKYQLKAVNILLSDKADEIFRKGDKNNWDIDRILTELAVPKEQKELIKSFKTRNREEILTSLLASYSYTVEINTAKGLGDTFSLNNKYYLESFEDEVSYYADIEGNEVITENVLKYRILNPNGAEAFEFENKIDAEKKLEELNSNLPNSNIYNNLTVPGGTNYTENEIATPAITPSIKGHAQFSTDKGIGWFRSDDKHPFTGFLEDLIASGTIKKVPCG